MKHCQLVKVFKHFVQLVQRFKKNKKKCNLGGINRKHVRIRQCQVRAETYIETKIFQSNFLSKFLLAYGMFFSNNDRCILSWNYDFFHKLQKYICINVETLL